MPSIFDTLREVMDGQPVPVPDPDDWRDDPLAVAQALVSGEWAKEHEPGKGT
jgi:hypothetical protein